MKPRFTLTITDNQLDKFMTIGGENFQDFKIKNSVRGKSAAYDLIDNFKREIEEYENSSNTSK